MDSKPSTPQLLGAQPAAAIAGLGSPNTASPHLANVMIAAATAAAARAAHDIGLGPAPSVDAVTAAAVSIIQSPIVSAAAPGRVGAAPPAAAVAPVPLSPSASVLLGVATMPMGSPDGTSAPKSIGSVGMTAPVGVKKPLALRTVRNGLLAAQSIEEGELQSEVARSLAIAAAASRTVPTAAAAVQALPKQQLKPIQQLLAGADALLSPFAVRDPPGACSPVANPDAVAIAALGVTRNINPAMSTQMSAYESGEIQRQQQSALKVIGVRSSTDQRKLAAADKADQQPASGGAVLPTQHERPHSGAAGLSRLGPQISSSSRAAGAAAARGRRPPGGGKVSAFKIANTSKQLPQKVSAAAAATFGRGVSPDPVEEALLTSSPASGQKSSRAPSSAPEAELAAAVASAAAAAAGAAGAASQQPMECCSQQQQRQQCQRQQHKSSSSPSRVRSRRRSSSGRRSSMSRGRSRSRDKGRSRSRSSSSDSRSRTYSRSSSRSSSKGRRYYSNRRRRRRSSSSSSSRGDRGRYHSSRPGCRGGYSRSKSALSQPLQQERSHSPSNRRYSRRFDAVSSARYDSSRQTKEHSRSRDRYRQRQRHRSSSRPRSRSRPGDRYRQRAYSSRYINRSGSSSRSRSPVRSHSKEPAREATSGPPASRPPLAQGGSDTRTRAGKDSQHQPSSAQAKAAHFGGSTAVTAGGAGAGVSTTATGRVAAGKTVSSSSSIEKQQNQEGSRNRSGRSRDTEADKPREVKYKHQQLQQHSAGAGRSKAGVGTRVGPFHNPMYCPNPPPSDQSIKFWRGRDGYVHDRQGNKWDANSKMLVEAGPGRNTAHGTDAAGRPAAAGGPRSSAAASRAGVPAPTDNSSKRQRRDPGAGGVSGAQQQQQRARQALVTRAAGSAAAMAAGVAPQGGGVRGSTLLPEELDVDMEIEEPLQHVTVQETTADSTGLAAPATSAGGRGILHKAAPEAAGSKGQQLRTRQFGSAARQPPLLTVSVAGRTPAPAAGTQPAPVDGDGGGAGAGGRFTTGASAPHGSPPPAGSPLAAGRASSGLEGGHSNSEYQGVAREALQHNLSTLDTTSFKSSATLELEASTLKSAAAKVAGSHGWDVRALLLHLSSGVKYLEWAHSFAGSGGVGVGLASISKQQAYKNNLTEAANIVRSCAKLAKQQIVARAAQVKAAGRSYQPMTAVDYAYAAVRLLADKLDAVASMNLLFVKTQGYNTTMRNLTQNTSPATAAALDGAASNAAAAGVPGTMAAPAARVPAAAPGAGCNGRGRGGGAAGPGGFGPTPGESGTQNSASSAIEFVAVAAEGSGRANDRADLADAVQEYITVTEHWASVADANEAYLQKTGRAAAAAAAEAAADGKAGRTYSGSGSESTSAAALAAAHQVGQLILAVGFEAGLWDLPSVLDIARQASDAIMNFAEAYGSSIAMAVTTNTHLVHN